MQGMHMKVLVRYIGTGCIFRSLESPSVLIQGMHYESFSKVSWDRVYVLRAEWFVTGVRFSTPSGTPSPNESRVPPPRAIFGIWGATWLTCGKHGIYVAVRGSYGALNGSNVIM